MKKIILTGGGTAGHVTPNLALVPELEARGYEILYIGSYKGIEKELAQKAGLRYEGIASGKLRRYIDLKNLSDPFRVMKGYVQAKKLIRDFQPDIIFSKGGFVAVPVTFAARNAHVPVIAHESDMTPGLANKLAAPAATKICCNFPETCKYLPEGKAVLTGSPIRAEILTGSRERGLLFAKLGVLPAAAAEETAADNAADNADSFTGSKPVLMIIGGSLGAVHVNEAVRKVLPQLLKVYDIIHICGRGNLDESLKEIAGYRQFEYVNEGLSDLFAAADVVISRAGANAICELLALHKPNLLIPLSAAASRGDQILNAASFEKQGYSLVLKEEDMTDETLLQKVAEVWERREELAANMAASPYHNGVGTIIDLIETTVASKNKQ